VDGEVQQKANELLDRLESRFGIDDALREKLHPLVTRIHDSVPPSSQREALIRLVIEIYAQHMKVRRTVVRLQRRLNHRINEAYGAILGIDPPNLG